MKYRVLYLAILAVLAIAWSSTGANAGGETPMTFTVDVLNDVGTGSCSVAGQCSLRNAITAAELNAGPDTIDFAASLTSGGPATITLSSALPIISQNITIEGPGSAMLTVDADASSGAQRRVFTLNSAEPCFTANISGMTITGGHIQDDGGGIQVNQDHILNLTDVMVTGNQTIYGDGGGIFFNIGELHLTDSMVIDNFADEDDPGGGDGGGIYGYGTLTLTNSDVIDNTADDDGGGIYLYLSASSTGPTVTGGMINLNDAGGSGGGLYLNSSTGGTVMLTGAMVLSNSASSGGGIHIPTYEVDVTVASSTIGQNMALSGSGGGLYMSSSNGTLLVENSSISDNEASVTGGGLHAYLGVSGGAMISSSSLSGNIAGSDGGGAFLETTDTIDIEASSVTGNTSGARGGGVWLGLAFSGAEVLNTTISGNDADEHGGGLYLYNTGGTSIIHNTITDNTADVDGNDNGSGGGIAQGIGDITVTNSIIAGNEDATILSLSAGKGDDVHPDCSGTITSDGVNLIGDDTGCTGVDTENDLVGGEYDAGLLALTQVPGLPISIHDLGLSSDAINAADPAECVDEDALGQTRNENACDIGAVESISVAIALYQQANDGCTIGGSGGAASSMTLLLLAVGAAFVFERRRRRS